MDLSSLKKKSVDISSLVNAAEQMSGSKADNNDSGTPKWKPTRDTAGNGYAVIRFLPAPDNDIGWTRYWDHGFQGPNGKWYIEKSLTTLDKDDPVGLLNQESWNSGDKEAARNRKRRLHYVSNILVLHDEGNPENNGKVFHYEFGKKIFDKLKEAMQPEFPDEAPINPWDLWNGADFVIKVRKVDGWVNYDKSEFKSPSELFDGDETKLQAVVDQIMPLAEYTDPATFKSFDQLQKQLNLVMGVAAPKVSAPVAAPVMETAASVEPTPQATIVPQTAEEDTAEVDEAEDDTLAYFRKIAEGA